MTTRRWSRSPSQVSSYERCPRAFEYQYLKKVKLANVWQIKGRAQHKALEHNFRQKIETGQDLPVDECVEVFHEEVKLAFSPMGGEEIVLFDDQSEAKVRKDGEAGLRVYLEKVAPGIQPLMVEEKVETTLPSGLRLTGKLDVVDDQMRIRDAKFPTDKMAGDELHYQDQPPLYGKMFFDKVGRWPLFLFDVVRTGRAKEPKPEAQEPLALQITAPLVEARIRDVEAIDAQINAGLFPRRPSPMNCNKCVYKHACWWGILPPKTEAPPAPAVERDLTPVLETSLAQAQAANGKQLELVGKA